MFELDRSRNVHASLERERQLDRSIGYIHARHCADPIAPAAVLCLCYPSSRCRTYVAVIGLFLTARLQVGHTLAAAAALAGLPSMPYQRGQFWVRRFQRQMRHVLLAAPAPLGNLGALVFGDHPLKLHQKLILRGGSGGRL